MRCRDGDLIFSPALTEALNGTGYSPRRRRGLKS